MKNIRIRKGRPEDGRHFSELVVMTSPLLMPCIFGSKVKKIMKKIFTHKGHLYSFDRSYFIEIDGKVAGMALLHKLLGRKRDKNRITLLLLKYMNWRLPLRVNGLLKSERLIKESAGTECYLSNIAVYPEFRSMGIGTKLLEIVEREVRAIGKKKIVLNAESYNKRAISLYERLGYSMESKNPVLKIRNRIFESFTFVKSVAS